MEYADQLFFEKNMDLKAATIEAARLRMRPIMMTAFSFILGVMPLIFASGVYATARNIMGMALVGGMLLATMLGIFIYPALYYLVARVGKFERKRELKTKRVMKRYFAIILFVAALASCTPKLYDAQVEVPENYRFAGDFRVRCRCLSPGGRFSGIRRSIAWWSTRSKNNRNLAQAASRIFEARANIAVARAPFLPSVGLNVSGAGNYTEPTGTTQQYTIEPSISWEVPLFGTLRSANRAAKAALYSSEWATGA